MVVPAGAAVIIIKSLEEAPHDPRKGSLILFVLAHTIHFLSSLVHLQIPLYKYELVIFKILKK